MLALLSIFGDIEEFIADDLYPLRYVITPIIILIGAAVVFLAVRQGVHIILWEHRFVTGIVAVPLILVSAGAGYFFLSPLFDRSFLDEASPLEAAAAPSDSMSAATPAPASSGSGVSPPAPVGATTGASVTQTGVFEGADSFHFGRGDALIISTDAGKVLRVENFSVRNGPDLFVYLSRDRTGESVEEALNLGSLKATDGAFNYDIPDAIDLAEVESVVVWCKQFGVLFAVAPLTAN